MPLFMTAFVTYFSTQHPRGIDSSPFVPRTSVLSLVKNVGLHSFRSGNRRSYFRVEIRFPTSICNKKIPVANDLNVKTPDDSADSSPQSRSSRLHAPADSGTFSSAYENRVPAWLLSRVKELGFTHPTPVQKEVLDVALPPDASHPGQDVVIHAQTGSGKTLAYLLPAIASIDPSRSCVQVLIVVPTQELGMQVYRLVRRVVSVYPHTGSDDAQSLHFDDAEEGDVDAEKQYSSFPVLPMLNQTDLRRQKLQLRHVAPRVIVGNPHRIAELVTSGRLRLDLLKALVVDEFDACLSDTSTTAALQTILSVRGRERPRQTILASATVPQHRHFLRQCVRQHWTRHDIKHVWIEQDSQERVPQSLTHWYAICAGPKKLAALRALLIRLSEQRCDPGTRTLCIRVIVFVMQSRPIGDIVEALNTSLDKYYGTDGAKLVVGLSNDLSIVHRRDAMKRFRAGDARVLISTDIAARGLDIPEVSHVFHFDLPTDPDSYLHRAGRTGRQGRPGSSIVLISPGEQFVINRTANALGIDFKRIGK